MGVFDALAPRRCPSSSRKGKRISETNAPRPDYGRVHERIMQELRADLDDHLFAARAMRDAGHGRDTADPEDDVRAVYAAAEADAKAAA